MLEAIEILKAKTDFIPDKDIKEKFFDETFQFGKEAIIKDGKLKSIIFRALCKCNGEDLILMACLRDSLHAQAVVDGLKDQVELRAITVSSEAWFREAIGSKEEIERQREWLRTHYRNGDLRKAPTHTKQEGLMMSAETKYSKRIYRQIFTRGKDEKINEWKKLETSELGVEGRMTGLLYDPTLN